MSVLRTLAELRESFSDILDVGVATSGVRHTTAVVNRRINKSVRRWYSMCADAGDDTYLTRYPISTSTSTPRTISIGAQYLRIRGIELLRGNVPVALQPGDFAERMEHEGSYVSTDVVGFPLYYKAGPGTGTPTVRIFPAADAVYTGIANVIPLPPILSLDADDIEVFASGDEWIANDAVMQVLITDQLADTAAFAALAARNAEIKRDMMFVVGCRNPVKKIDSRGIEKRNRLRVRTLAS
jgi:hypothetical protein